MDPKQVVVPVERGRNFDRHLEMMNGFHPFALRLVDFTKDAMRFADEEFLALFGEEAETARHNFYCGVELFVFE